MPLKQNATPYPLIDSDPHAARVVRYMRTNDYAVWAGATAAGPAALYLYEKVDPTRYKHGLGSALRLTGFLGFCAGFMLAYQQSSFRFMGIKENAPEVKRDMEELSALAKAGKPVYGETDMPEYIQGVANRNSAYSQFKFQTIPWFNVVNHKLHGVDTAKYGEGPSSQEQPS